MDAKEPCETLDSSREVANGTLHAILEGTLTRLRVFIGNTQTCCERWRCHNCSALICASTPLSKDAFALRRRLASVACHAGPEARLQPARRRAAGRALSHANLAGADRNGCASAFRALCAVAQACAFAPAIRAFGTIGSLMPLASLLSRSCLLRPSADRDVRCILTTFCVSA
eukprot:659246-Pleurochrysis_carterae.AAC.3